MSRFTEAIRDPKWIAVGLTVLVLVGGTLKFLLTVREDTAATATPDRTVQKLEGIDVDPGTYAILDTSWNKGGDGATAKKTAKDETDDLADQQLLTEEEREFYRNAHKTWNGICIAVQGK